MLPGLESAQQRRDLSQWYTPRETASRIAGLALRDAYGKRRSPHVLEPSAGQGALIDALREFGIDNITAIDADPSNIEYLRDRKGMARAICADFLEWQPTAGYDLAVMNPPFEDGQAEAHILKALECALVVVCHCPLTTLAGQDRCEKLWSKVTVNRLAICSSRPSYGKGNGATDMCTVQLTKATPFHARYGTSVPGLLAQAVQVEWWP